MLIGREQMHCPSCGKDIELEWRFCLKCGAPLPAQTGDAGSQPTNPGLIIVGATDTQVPTPGSYTTAERDATSATDEQRPRRRRLPAVMAAAAALILAGTGLYMHLQVRSNLQETEQTLAWTQSELKDAQTKLDTTSKTLEETRVRLDQTAVERDSLRQELEQVRVDLEGVEGSLQASQRTVRLKTGQIEVLKTCLDGVAAALAYIVYGEYYAASDALSRVENACRRAFALF